MDLIARVIVSHSKRVLAATAILTLTAVAMLFRMDFNADIAGSILESNAVGREFNALNEKYETADPINVILSQPEGRSFDEPGELARISAARDELAELADVRLVTSVIPETNPLTGDPLTPEAVASMPAPAVERVLAQNLLSDLFLSEDNRHALLMVTPGDDALEAARAVSDWAEARPDNVAVSGNPVVFSSVIDLINVFLLVIPPAVILLLLLVFYANIGDKRLAGLSIFPAIVGSIWTFGLIFGLGREVDLVTVIVPIFVIVMGSADGLHFVTHFQQADAPNPVERVSDALRHVGIPMILTTISTGVGFLALLATDVGPIRQLGLFTAIGIGFAGVVSFFSLPAVISHMDLGGHRPRDPLGGRIVGVVNRLVSTRTPALALGVGLIAFAAVFVPRLDVDSDQLFFYKDDDPVRVAFERSEQLFGGATPLMGEFAYDPTAGPSQLRLIEQATDDLEALPGVRRVISAATLVEVLPEEQARALLSGEIQSPIGDLVSNDGLRFMLLPSRFTTSDLQSWLSYASSSDTVTALTGMPVVWDEIARLVLNAQVTSLAVAFGLVAIMLYVAYRELRQTVVSIVPIALTVATLLAFLAASGIQLNLLTAVASSIVIGVGIDYSIHYVAAIDRARRDGPGYVYRALDRAGRPIVANALGIAIGLTALVFSPLAIHGQVSAIMWVSMITAALAALLIIPALLPREGTL